MWILEAKTNIDIKKIKMAKTIQVSPSLLLSIYSILFTIFKQTLLERIAISFSNAK